MALTRTQIIIVGAVVLLIFIIIGVFFLGGRGEREKSPEFKLTIWGIEDKNVFYDILPAFNALPLRDKIQVKYQEMNPATYENDLLNALAAGQGPDIFMFKNTWLPKHYNKIAPASETQFNLVRLRELFPTVVEQDFAPDGVIFALPLYIDTLALYYNMDIFNTSGIAFAPATWIEFQKLIPQLRKTDDSGKITKPAAAIGGSAASVETSTDILSLLMLQAGAKMTNDQFTQATFADRVSDPNRVGDSIPGEDALGFYTKFSDPTNTYYTWNDGLGSSLNEFAQGRLAMMFDYNYQKENLKSLNPFLKFRANPMLQPNIHETAVNFARYWGFTVSNKSANPEWAWDLVVFLTTDASIAEAYLKNSGQPPALLSLIQKYTNDPEIGLFAKQALSARSWPQADEKAVNNIFSQMIMSVNNQQLNIRDALRQAQASVSDLMRSR